MEPTAATAQLSGQVWRRIVVVAALVPPWWEAWSPWAGAPWRPSRAPVRHAFRHPGEIHPAASSSPSRSGDGSARITGPNRLTGSRSGTQGPSLRT
jgi:hypothetical protein